MEQLEAGFDQLLFGEGVADLHAGTLFFEGLVELLAGQHRGAADAVAARLGADQHDVVAGATGEGAHDLVGAHEARRHGVDQTVAFVARLEVDLAAHRGDAEAVAVEADAADHAVEQEPLARVGGAVDLAEAQRVEADDGPRAHGEDVAHDAADAGGGALEGLDRRRVVVAFDLHGHGPAVADVDDAGVLAGSLQDARAGRGEAAEDGPRVFVAAVLAPHERVDGELDVGWLAALDLADVGVFLGRQARLAGRLEGGAARLGRAHRTAAISRTSFRIDWKKTRPSVPPARPGSTEFSGCGMRPKTLKAALQTPAMPSRAPLGLESSRSVPSGSQ